MTKKNFNTVVARDILISLANKLPDTLLVDAVNEEGRFTTAFLLWLNDEQLSNLRNEAKKHGKENIFLFFYSISEEKIGQEAPFEVRNFSSFDFSKVVSMSFNGSTVPLLPYIDCPPIHYVSVTFVLKS